MAWLSDSADSDHPSPPPRKSKEEELVDSIQRKIAALQNRVQELEAENRRLRDLITKLGDVSCR